MTVVLFKPGAPVVPVHASTTSAPIEEAMVWDRDGDRGALVGAQVVEYGGKVLTKDRTELATATITIPKNSPGLSNFKAPNGKPRIGYPWIKVERDGVPRFRGYIGAEEDYQFNWITGLVTIEFTSLEGLLDRTFFGDAERTNSVVDGDMEDAGVTDWPVAGTCTRSKTSWSRRGTQGLQLHGGSSGGYAYQYVDLPLSTNRQLWHITGDSYTFNGDQPGFGLVVTRIYDGTIVQQFDRQVDVDNVTGQWQSWVSDVIPIDPGHSDVKLLIELHAAPGSNPVWDNIFCTRNENTGVVPGGDIAQLTSTMLKYGIAKQNLPITVSTTLTGKTLADGYTYPHAENAQVLSSVLEWPEIELAYDPVHSVLHNEPRVGTDRDWLTIADGWSPQITDVAFTGAAFATSVTTIGDEAPDAVTRQGKTAALVDPDILIEIIDVAPKGMSPKDIDARPADILDQRSDPGVAVSAKFPKPSNGRSPGDWMELGFGVGDGFPSRLQFGALMDADYWLRVTDWTCKPPQGDALEVELMSTLET